MPHDLDGPQPQLPPMQVAEGDQVGHGGRTVRCVRAVRKVGCSPPWVPGSWILLLQPLLVHQGCILIRLMLATGPRVLNSAPPMLV